MLNILLSRTRRVLSKAKTRGFRESEKTRLEDRVREADSVGLLAVDSSRLLARYTVGVVEYRVYRGDDGLPRMKVIEPPPLPEDRIAEIVSGADEPSNLIEDYYMRKALSGYDKLYPLVIDNNVEEIAVEGAGKSVLVVSKLFPAIWIEVDMVLSESELDSLVLKLGRKIGRSVSLTVPYAEGLTPEGYRVAITFKREVSRAGSSIVLRKYPEKPVTMADLIASRTLSPLMASYLWMLLEAQSFIIIAGGMGAGKTTLLQALLTLIPPFSRVVTIEDTPELNLSWHYWDALVTRPGTFAENLPDIDLEDLLKFALRRRADYLVVGEVRGREARLLAQAAALGHGCVTTFHADSAESAIARLQMEPISLPSLFLKSISSIVVLRKVVGLGWRARRRVWEIAEIQGDEVVSIFSWDPTEDKFKPTSEREVAEASVSLQNASRRLDIVQGSLETELASRAEYLERLVGLSPDEFIRAVKRFYVMRYGVA
ncbi:MAG: type II/IV secretion system ATPase subunit [Acidilobaceae archaeon]